MKACVRSVSPDGGPIPGAERTTSVVEEFVRVESGIVDLGKGTMIVLVPSSAPSRNPSKDDWPRRPSG